MEATCLAGQSEKYKNQKEFSVLSPFPTKYRKTSVPKKNGLVFLRNKTKRDTLSCGQFVWKDQKANQSRVSVNDYNLQQMCGSCESGSDVIAMAGILDASEPMCFATLISQIRWPMASSWEAGFMILKLVRR